MTHRTSKTTILLLLIILGLIILRVVSMPPQFYESKFHFTMYASELDMLLEEFDKISSVQSITLVGSSLLVEGNFGDASTDLLIESQKERILQLMIDIGVPRIRRVEIGKIVVIGSQEKFGKTYQISFIEYNDLTYLDPPNCEESPDGGFGVCSFPLANSWALRYEWLPAVLGEKQNGS